MGRVSVPEAGEYLLIFDAKGQNANAKEVISSGRAFHSYGLADATLTAVPPEAGPLEKVTLAIDGVEAGAPMPLDTSKQLQLTLTDALGIVIKDREYTVSFTSSAPDVAQVHEDGTVAAVGVGQTTISATVACGGVERTETYALTVETAGRNLMEDRNPDFENDEWYWGTPRQDQAPSTPQFLRIMIGEQGTEANPHNRALGMVMDPSVAAVTNPRELMLATDGSRVKIEPGKFYQLSFMLKKDYVIPEGASDIQFLLDTYGYSNTSGASSADIAGDMLRNVDLSKQASWSEYGEWKQVVMPIAAPLPESAPGVDALYISPRLVIRPVAGDLSKAGYGGTIWIDDFELREVGFSGVKLELAGSMASLDETILAYAKPYASTGNPISLNAACFPDCVAFGTEDAYVAAAPKNPTRVQAATGDGVYYIRAETKLGGKRGSTELSADVTLNGVTRTGRATVTPKDLPLILLYAEAQAENPTVQAGGTTRLSVKGFMSDGTEADLSGAAFSYTSSDRRVAQVSQDGVITAGGAGSAAITVAINLNGTTVETTAPITVADDSELLSIALAGPETVGYLRDEPLTLTGEMASGYAANMGLAQVEYIVDSQPAGAVSVSPEGLVYGHSLGGTAEIRARASLGGGEVRESNPITVTVVKSDPRDVVVNFKAVDTREIPAPKNAELARDGWELNTSLTGSLGMNSLFVQQGIQSNNTAANNTIALDINVPYTGDYTLIVQGATGPYGAISDVYIDGLYAGQYNFYTANADVALAQSLRSVSLDAGVHTVVFRAVANPGRG